MDWFNDLMRDVADAGEDGLRRVLGGAQVDIQLGGEGGTQARVRLGERRVFSAYALAAVAVLAFLLGRH